MIQTSQQIHKAVQERYGRLAVESPGASCCSSDGDCCGTTASVLPADVAVAGEALDAIYSNLYTADTGWLPTEVTGLSLGCGDPITLAALQPGQTVLDLGSGGGIDAFMAARQVGPAGRVIGVDMTPQMLARAESNKAKVGLDNVEFRQGYIEALPVADGSVDVILSNCVINLSPDKAAVFREAYRVLRPGRPPGGVGHDDPRPVHGRRPRQYVGLGGLCHRRRRRGPLCRGHARCRVRGYLDCRQGAA